MAPVETVLCRRVLDVLILDELAALGVPIRDLEALQAREIERHRGGGAKRRRGAGRPPHGIAKRAVMAVDFYREMAAGAQPKAAALAVAMRLGVAPSSVELSADALRDLLWGLPQAAALCPAARLDFVDLEVRAWRARAQEALQAAEQRLAAEADEASRARRAARHGLDNRAFSHR